tara:strand:- start:170 stop:556 length:387 start_codon:yes stop_codon:yes gene_type:complete
MTYLFNMPDFKDITFDRFYSLYPRKVGRVVAQRSFTKLNKRDKQLAYDGLLKYIRFWESSKTEKQFIPHPSTWLNQKRWEDELEDLKEVIEENVKNETLQKVRESEGAEEHEVQEALASFFNKRRKWK